MAQKMSEKIELSILGIFCSTKYYRKVVPVKPEYFEDHHERIIYEEVWNFASSYDTVRLRFLSLTSRIVRTSRRKRTTAVQTLKSFEDMPVEHQWLLDTTESGVKTE